MQENQAHMDMEYLRRNEIAQQKEREKQGETLAQLQEQRRVIQHQIDENNRMREEARREYEREREQVDRVVQRMIEEDAEMTRIMSQKKDQAQNDMIMSQSEKRALQKRQAEMERYEDEMVRRYAA